jgi:hypothetical protein
VGNGWASVLKMHNHCHRLLINNVPVAGAKLLPRQAQELLGYAFYDTSKIVGGYLGYHDMDDPMKLFVGSSS